MASPKVVWVLGSGFSKHLGGPLLNQLLTRRALDETERLFFGPTLPRRDMVYEIFRNYGKPISNAPYWEHAEEFLDFLDTATFLLSKRHEIVRDFCKPYVSGDFDGSPHELWRRSCIAIGAECTAFLSEFDPAAEACEPYLRWGQELVTAGDAIISFNYDRVLEEVGEQKDRVSYFSQNTVQMPQGNAIRGGIVPIFKLHGSVDWFFKADDPRKQVTRKADFGQAISDGYTPLIATPGSTKKNYCDMHLQNLWRNAKDHLRVADVIVFMGYRFPPSDSQALTELLGAIKANDQPTLRVHTALGPHTGEADTVRLGSLLRHTMRAKRSETKSTRYRPANRSDYDDKRKFFQMLVQPLYAQDFMSVVTPEELCGEYSPISFLLEEGEISGARK